MPDSEITLNSFEELNNFINTNLGVIVYFSTPDCNVCKVLKPKVKEMLKEEFPQIQFAYVDLSSAKELAAQHSIFTVPTLVIYFEGKEFLRKSRNISIEELREEISRPYSFLFS